MSKKSKKAKKNRRKTPPLNACDRHHICFTKSTWNRGYARLICHAFVRPVPVIFHRELHYLLHDVHVPDENLLKEAWCKYIANRDEIDKYGVMQATAWLYVNIPDVEFRKGMQFQIDFFATRFGQF